MSCILFAVYTTSLAPTVTLWDSGEFLAAVASSGIPHPPGTPLYILIARAWSSALGALPLAVAVNLLSAVATATACGLLGGLMARWTGSRLAGVAAGISSGTTLAVWQNATETEVYALSLLLAVLMVVVGDRAGALRSTRHRVLLAFLMALAVPLQISALVAAPAAIFLAARDPEGAALDWRVVSTLGATFLAVTGAGLVSPAIAAAGVAGLLLSTTLGTDRPGARAEVARIALVVVLGLTATLFMLFRAPHEPLVNQGNPATWGAFMDHVARRQYPLPGIWPRRAPVWAQLLNVVQYADWQVAMGLDDNVAASWRRTPWSIVALLLTIAGFRWHHRRHRSSAYGAMVLFLAGSAGIVAILNLRAGPSIIDSVLPAGTTHEPRERDYFFALAFAMGGAWMGAGIVAVVRRLVSPMSPKVVTGVALVAAGLPLVLNWRAADRRRLPGAALADTYGEALLASAPQNAVVLTAGDNDSYTVWYRQAALGERTDVVPVTVPLLGAAWYRDEQRRRHQLLDAASVGRWTGEEAILRDLAASARQQGRPVAVSIDISSTQRAQIAPAWTLHGLLFVARFDEASTPDRVDGEATRRVADLVARRIPEGGTLGRDPAAAWVARQLRCPREVLAALGAASDRPASSLDSRCNFK